MTVYDRMALAEQCVREEIAKCAKALDGLMASTEMDDNRKVIYIDKALEHLQQARDWLDQS